LNYQATYVWSKALSTCADQNCGIWANAANRSLDKTLQGSDRRHEFRVNGGWELPFGPNRPFLSNSGGFLARILEQFQLSWIVDLTSGAPNNLGAPLPLPAGSTISYIGYSRPNLIGSFPRQGEAQMTSTLPVYFSPGTYQTVTDPQCVNVTPLQGL